VHVRELPVRPLVTVVAVRDAAPPSQLADTLRREGFDVRHLPLEVLLRESALDHGPVIAWLGSPSPPHPIAALLEWRGRRGALLVGCAPEGSTADREHALALGFDDYMTGAISLRELAARLRALGRQLRTADEKKGPKGELRLGRMLLAPTGNALWIDDRRVPLTRLERKALQALVAARGRVVTREELGRWVWGAHAKAMSERAIDNLVQRLRKKLDLPGAIHTVRGMGFRLFPG
jgi:DNA-binding response OmpR family regulator